MSRFLIPMALSVLLIAGCSDRQRSNPDAEEWIQIEALAGETPTGTSSRTTAPQASESQTAYEPDEEFVVLAGRLREMKTIERQSGQTLLTGDRLLFEYLERFVRMDGQVLVDDDNGQLRTESLIGRFTAANEVEHIEARGRVSIDAGGRHATADEAVYNYRDGTVVMQGRARLSEAGNSLSGEQIRFWLTGDRRMICEPNALLMLEGRAGLAVDGMPDEVGDTEIRADRIVYDDGKRRVDLIGTVRLRNPQVDMNCNEIHLFLKDENEIDWIEAVGDVIIQSQGRKALADKAVYNADEGKFTLEGRPPMVKTGRNVMTGDRIIFWHETQVVLCEPNGRVLYYYDLDEETRNKFPEDLDD